MQPLGLDELLERFFAWLNERRLDECQALLQQARLLADPDTVLWIEYLEAIWLVEQAPPRWDLAEVKLQSLASGHPPAELLARVHLEIAFGADYLGDYRRALDHYRSSLALFQQLGDRLYQAKVLTNTAIAHVRAFERGQAGQAALHAALDCLQESQSLCQKLGHQRLAATIDLELGAVYKALGRWQEALDRYQDRAERVRRLGWQRPLALTLNNLGEMYQQLGQYGQADACFQEALAILASLPTADPYEEADVWSNLALNSHAQGQIEAARQASERAVAIVETMRRPLASERARIGLLSARIHAYERKVWLELQLGLAAEALTTLERSKSRAFVELLADRHMSAEARAAGGRLLTAAEIQAQMPEDALLLEYFMTTGYACVFAVTRQQITVTALDANLHSVLPRLFEPEQQRLARLTPGAGGQLHAPWPLARLRSLLIEPVEQQVAHCRQLLVAPHDLLHFVPFSALLAEPGPVTYHTPSATVMLDYCQNRPRQPGKGAMVVSFGPDLRHGRNEAAAVFRLLGGVWFDGAAATRDAVLDMAGQFPVLHFACHAHFDPADPTNSGLELSDGRLTAQAILDRMTLQAELVVLSACETGRNKLHRGDELIGLARAFLAAGAPAVMVTLWPVDDVSTRLLMEMFYERMLAGATPTDALRSAQLRLKSLTTDALKERLRADGLSAQEIARKIEQLQARAAGADGDHLLVHPYYWAPFVLVGGRLKCPVHMAEVAPQSSLDAV